MFLSVSFVATEDNAEIMQTFFIYLLMKIFQITYCYIYHKCYIYQPNFFSKSTYLRSRLPDDKFIQKLEQLDLTAYEHLSVWIYCAGIFFSS